MNNKRIIIGVTIGIIAAILWSVVFINVLNSMAGIGIGLPGRIKKVVLPAHFQKRESKHSNKKCKALPFS